MTGTRPFIDRSRRHIVLPLCGAVVIGAIASAYAIVGKGAPASGCDDFELMSRQLETFTFPRPSAPHPAGSGLWYTPPSWGYRNVLSPIDRVR